MQTSTGKFNLVNLPESYQSCYNQGPIPYKSAQWLSFAFFPVNRMLFKPPGCQSTGCPASVMRPIIRQFSPAFLCILSHNFYKVVRFFLIVHTSKILPMILDAGYWILDAGYWMLDTGRSMLDAR